LDSLREVPESLSHAFDSTLENVAASDSKDSTKPSCFTLVKHLKAGCIGLESIADHGAPMS
jgi:hypothetical protein